MNGVATPGAIVVLWAGVVLIWVGIVGMIRARDGFARLHFSGAAALVGPPAAATALGLAEGVSPTVIRSSLIFVLLLLTSGILTHATAHAEWRRRQTEDRTLDRDGGPIDEAP